MSDNRMISENNRASHETGNTNGGMSVYISNPNMEDDNSSGSHGVKHTMGSGNPYSHSPK